MPPVLSADVWWRVAHFTSNREHLDLARLSKGIYDLVIPMIYGHLDIGPKAFQFVHSLAFNPRLPPLVRELCFHQGSFVNDVEWAAVLVAMKNLKFLYVTRGIDFPLNVLPRITFSLTTFGSRGSVIGSWAMLVASQPTIVELKLNDDYYDSPPGPGVLPALHAVKGRPADLARFARHHALEDMWFFSGPPHERRSLKEGDIAIFAKSPSRLITVRLTARQFILLVHWAPAMMATLQHIVLDECPEWSEFTRNPSLAVVRGDLARVAQKINQCAPLLKSMLLAFSQNVSDRHPAIRPLLRTDGGFFLNSFNAITPVPHFKTFRVYASNGCITWENWGSADQITSYLPPPPDHGPLELEPELHVPPERYPSERSDRRPIASVPISQVLNIKKFEEQHKSSPLQSGGMHDTSVRVYAVCKRAVPLPRSKIVSSEDFCCIKGSTRPGSTGTGSEGPQRKKKKRRSLLPRPTPPVHIPLEQPRRLRRNSVPTPQESAKRAEVDLNPEAEASWQDAFSVLPDIVLQWAAGTLPTGDESSDAENSEIADLPPDILMTPAEVAEQRQQNTQRRRRLRDAPRAYQTDGEAAETSWRGALPRRPRRRVEELLTAAQREDRYRRIRTEIDRVCELRRQQAREQEEAWELERKARLPGLRRVIVDAMRPWEREEFLRVELEQERQEERNDLDILRLDARLEKWAVAAAFGVIGDGNECRHDIVVLDVVAGQGRASEFLYAKTAVEAARVWRLEGIKDLITYLMRKVTELRKILVLSREERAKRSRKRCTCRQVVVFGNSVHSLPNTNNCLAVSHTAFHRAVSPRLGGPLVPSLDSRWLRLRGLAWRQRKPASLTQRPTISLEDHHADDIFQSGHAVGVVDIAVRDSITLQLLDLHRGARQHLYASLDRPNRLPARDAISAVFLPHLILIQNCPDAWKEKAQGDNSLFRAETGSCA
ncbi:hypothetical protein B0H16DRAFT_1482172 [Mycena metata]|uniref:Uncharacterized protein n=1 Tax=Mycena metata TaxID=1033252 RepID=A0AAD7M8E4_9AGAR|nr:hypothetical protein B0H16DRAFT_1482172 [Mycena metata]